MEEGAEPWGRAQICFKAVRQAEMWVRAGKAGLLLEQSWVWSTAQQHCRAFDWKQIDGLPVGMSPAASQQD